MGFLDNPFGGLFDFNKDGKEDLGELWIAHKIFEEASNSEDKYEDNDFDYDNDEYCTWRDTAEDGTEFGIYPEDYDTEEEYEDALEEAKYAWRDTVEDGTEFGIDPEYYETEEEYNDALEEKFAWRDTAEDGAEFGVYPEDYDTEDEYEEALEEEKYAWRDTAEGGTEFGIDPEDYETEEEYEEALEEASSEVSVINIPISLTLETNAAEKTKIKESDYPNKRRYNAAVTLYERYIIYANKECEQREKNRCRFILEQSDKIIAANYLTIDGDFLYSQAIKDNFEIPVTLPDEDEAREFSLYEILIKIHKKDVQLALNIWEWCVNQFLPYSDYSSFGKQEMTNRMLDGLYDFTDQFKKAFREHLSKHTDFRTKLIREADDVPSSLAGLIINMIKDGHIEAAAAMFDDGLYKSGGKWKKVNNLMGGLINSAKNYNELETIEFVEMNFLPKMTQYSDGMILDEVEGWQQEISEYKTYVERNSEKYAFSRSNAWRNTSPDGSKYRIDPRNYDTEQEYSDALKKAKYAWRDQAAQINTLGLDPGQYETKKEYEKAWRERYNKQQRQRAEQILEQRKKREAELLKDKTIYTYCGVKFPFSQKLYSYRFEDSSLKIGDTVIVPVGEENNEEQGIVVSIGQYARIGAPYPPEKTKFILKKKSENNSEENENGKAKNADGE